MSEELLNESLARIDDLLAPINGGAGADVSYDEQFEQVKLEVDKLSSLSGENCNWGIVASLSEEILVEKSKDFRIGCYLACTKMREGDLTKVLDGLVLVRVLMERYWDTMFPPLNRLRARAGMVGWMSDQSGEQVAAIKLKAGDAALVKLIDEQSLALDQLGRTKFADHYPGMSKLREAIRGLARSVPKEAPKPAAPPPAAAPTPAAPAPAAAPAAEAAPAAVPPPAAAPAPAAAPMTAAPSGGGATAASLVTAAEARGAVQPTTRLLVKMGQLLRGEKPENPMAYKLSRFGMWLEVTQVPAVMEGRTLVEAPGAHIKTRLDGLASSNDWLTLLNEADTQGGNFILWLDPQRYVATAMSALGALFLKAKEELLLQVALMLKKVPSLPQLKFSDGTPYADAQTQMWIENEVKPLLAADGGGGGAAPSVLDEPLKEAKDHAMKGDLGKALSVVMAASDAAPTPAERFRGRLALAQLCLGAGQLDIAKSQLEGLTEIIRRHELALWDPRLAGEVYAALYSAYRGLNSVGTPTAEAKAAEEATFERLCQLDAATALRLAPKKA
ncbi:MAG: type VI secretion system protein TssA [Deltaproteobacteria bacterium]|nr:type VI secretion system protein TssA [Deltaproteobacteria bacterium]